MAEAFEAFCDQAPTCLPASPPSTISLLAMPAPASADTLIFGQTPHSPVSSFLYSSAWSGLPRPLILQGSAHTHLLHAAFSDASIEFTTPAT